MARRSIQPSSSSADVIEQRVRLHVRAPEKPAVGAPCNGCGVCCALETCPLARVRFLRRQGPCPALEWSDSAGRYQCGMLVRPSCYLALPSRLDGLLSRLCARWIAAGIGCDCTAEVGSN